jgi:hypothetical protein
VCVCVCVWVGRGGRRRSHLAGKAVVNLADRAEEVVDVVVVNAPSRAVGRLAMKGVVTGVVLRLGDGLGEVLLVNLRRDELRMHFTGSLHNHSLNTSSPISF